MTAFMPQRKKPFEETLRELEEMEKERRDLERKLYLCRNSKRSERKGAESPRALEKKLTALYEQAEVMLKEVNRQTDCLKKGRRQYFRRMKRNNRIMNASALPMAALFLYGTTARCFTANSKRI